MKKSKRKILGLFLSFMILMTNILPSIVFAEGYDDGGKGIPNIPNTNQEDVNEGFIWHAWDQFPPQEVLDAFKRGGGPNGGNANDYHSIIHQLRVNLNGSTPEVVYCYNADYKVPYRSTTTPHYRKIEAKGDVFSRKAIKPRLQGEELNKAILRIIYNGYPNNTNGILDGLSPVTQEFITQRAIWYYTDSKDKDSIYRAIDKAVTKELRWGNSDKFTTYHDKGRLVEDAEVIKAAFERLIDPDLEKDLRYKVPDNHVLSLFETNKKHNGSEPFQNLLSARYIPDPGKIVVIKEWRNLSEGEIIPDIYFQLYKDGEPVGEKVKYEGKPIEFEVDNKDELDLYTVKEVDAEGNEWKEKDFSTELKRDKGSGRFTFINKRDNPGKTKIILNKVKMNSLEGWPKEGKYQGEFLDIKKAFGPDAENLPGVDFTITNTKTGEKVENPNPIAGKDSTIFTTNKDGKFELTLEDGSYKIEEVPRTYLGPNGEIITGSAYLPLEFTLPQYINKEEKKKYDEENPYHLYALNTTDKPEIDKNYQKEHGYPVVTDNNGNTNDGALYENYAKEKSLISAYLGSNVPYEVKTRLPKGSSHSVIRWTDTMTRGLSFNNDISVEGFDASDYEVTVKDDGFVLNFTEAGLEKVNERLKEADVEFLIHYTAKVNSNAITDLPDRNHIEFDYGNGPTVESEPTPTTPSQGKIQVVKSWDNEEAKANDVTYNLYKVVDGREIFVNSHKVTDGNYNHTFDNLENGVSYVVREAATGFVAEYSSEEGTVYIKNHKSPRLVPTEPQVVTYGRKFVKVDAENEDEKLLGAQFIVRDSQDGNKILVLNTDDGANLKAARDELTNAVQNYNSYTGEDENERTKLLEAVETAQNKYNEAFINSKKQYDWIEWNPEDELPENAVVLVSNNEGQFEITGLQKGEYWLEEIKAPFGYVKNENRISFEAKEGSYAGKEGKIYDSNQSSVQKVTNRKMVMPHTGGIGSQIIMLAGLSLMLIAMKGIKKNRYNQ